MTARPCFAVLLLLGSAGCVPASQIPDAGPAPEDAAPADAGSMDAEVPDVGPADTGWDGGGFDAAPMDAEPMDAEPPDAGPQLCPTEPDPECAMVQECQDDLTPPSNCEPCTPYNRSICGEGLCSTPAPLGDDDIYTLVINVSPSVTGIESFATFALSERTAGGRVLTCEDFYEDLVSLQDDCLNVLDTRAYALPQTGDTYAVSFGRFASGERTLFLVYGYRGAQPEGPRLGVSCTIYDVPAPSGAGPYLVSGETMLPLP